VLLVASVQIPARLLTVQGAAEFLGISRNGLYIACRDCRVPHFKVGGAIRFDLDELRAWLESNRRGPQVAG
jgi:excisionase family DNA binding protein